MSKLENPNSGFQKSWKKIQCLFLLIILAVLAVNIVTWRSRINTPVQMFPNDFEYETATVPSRPDSIQEAIAQHAGWEVAVSAPSMDRSQTIITFKRLKK